MKVVLQRVSEAAVMVRDEQVGAINNGMMLLVGIHEDDAEEDMEWLAEKILNLRIFDDEKGRMNLSVVDVQGEILVVPQFTLYGDYEQGNRPSYIEAADPSKAEPLYEAMVSYFRKHSELKVQTGRFGAYMDVQLHNDGPVTLVLER
ncbi:D-aminoacyl-tRNA deacylase [Fodinibius sediminis]|uniref:D-aminoacyl-tRNA deacylase n=1 Tax=Fodinibius sediminis TaxID=1214077 RepID=A0A521BEL4_9BACT|nr:D-aminoacyl-tRNA deacylase [Fodinibius sediminis]SMO45524.1 D-tyrosyl-tRNA(Tyr) deacylase [Fodinibius sediminis]